MAELTKAEWLRRNAKWQEEADMNRKEKETGSFNPVVATHTNANPNGSADFKQFPDISGQQRTTTDKTAPIIGIPLTVKKMQEERAAEARDDLAPLYIQTERLKQAFIVTNLLTEIYSDNGGDDKMTIAGAAGTMEITQRDFYIIVSRAREEIHRDIDATIARIDGTLLRFINPQQEG